MSKFFLAFHSNEIKLLQTDIRGHSYYNSTLLSICYYCRQMVQSSFTHFDQLLNSSEAMSAGVSRLSGYILFKEKPPEVKGNFPCITEFISFIVPLRQALLLLSGLQYVE